MLVRRTEPVPIECVARGYLSGSGWKEYQQTGSVCGVRAAGGPARIGPAAGADLHAGDQGRERPRREHQRGRSRSPGRRHELVARLKALTLEIYRRGAAHAESKGIIIADTKFEFGLARRRGDAATRTDDRADRRSADARLVALLAASRSTSPARASQASTSSSCATISKRSAGTSSRRCRRCPTTSCVARARSTSKRSACCQAAS